MDNEEKSALLFFFVGLAITGAVVTVVLGLVWSRNTVTMSGPAASKPITQVATTTMPTEWKTYSSKEAGFSFVYPTVLTLNEEKSKIELSHSINFENHGTCDMKGDEETYPTLEDINLSIEVKKMSVAKAAKQVSPYIPEENFTKDSLKVSEGFIDEYSVGKLKGFAIYEGAEGCGQMTYYFPLTSTSTLVAQKRIPQQLSGVLSSNIEQEILATPGAISRQESDKILQQILTSFSLLTDQAPWKTYRNEEYGFEFSLSKPTQWEEKSDYRMHKFRVEQVTSGSKFVMFGIRNLLNSDNSNSLQKYSFDGGGDILNLSAVKMTKLGGSQAGYFVYDSCSEESCPNPFVAIVTIKDNLGYELYFYGDNNLDSEELNILESFKFTK